MATDYHARAMKGAATRRQKKLASLAAVHATAPLKGPLKKSEPTVNLCLCGCEKSVKGQFAIGHDAKLHSQVMEAFRFEKKLPSSVRKLAAEYIAKRWPAEAKEVL